MNRDDWGILMILLSPFFIFSAWVLLSFDVYKPDIIEEMNTDIEEISQQKNIPIKHAEDVTYIIKEKYGFGVGVGVGDTIIKLPKEEFLDLLDEDTILIVNVKPFKSVGENIKKDIVTKQYILIKPETNFLIIYEEEYKQPTYIAEVRGNIITWKYDMIGIYGAIASLLFASFVILITVINTRGRNKHNI